LGTKLYEGLKKTCKVLCAVEGVSTSEEKVVLEGKAGADFMSDCIIA
jgi:hypothetical protein